MNDSFPMARLAGIVFIAASPGGLNRTEGTNPSLSTSNVSGCRAAW